jgi:quercetin dioxygenase-like cupin family protein
MSECVIVAAESAPYPAGVICKVRSDQTDAAFTVLALSLPAGAAVPLHVHQREDEILQVLEGECVIEHNGQRYLLHAGGLAVLPKGQAHAFANPAATPNRLQITAIPGGLDHYFADLATLGPDATAAQVAALNERCGLDFAPNG